MKVEATIINPKYEKAVNQLEYDLRHSKCAKYLTIRGEMMSQDYDNFTCVVLAEDGTYHKISLYQVKVIKDEQNEEA